MWSALLVPRDLQPAAQKEEAVAGAVKQGAVSERQELVMCKPSPVSPSAGFGCVRTAELEGSARAMLPPHTSLWLGHLPGNAGICVLDLLICRTGVIELIAGIGIVEVPPDTRHVLWDLEVTVLFGCNLEESEGGGG